MFCLFYFAISLSLLAIEKIVSQSFDKSFIVRLFCYSFSPSDARKASFIAYGLLQSTN